MSASFSTKILHCVYVKPYHNETSGKHSNRKCSEHADLVWKNDAGYKIKKDTAVVINYWALHHDPKAWNNVNQFIPERFLDKNGQLCPKPMNWLPFSAGERKCLGEFVAKPQILLLFACLMQRYRWRVLPGKSANLTPTGNCFGRVCKPYRVTVEKRT